MKRFNPLKNIVKNKAIKNVSIISTAIIILLLIAYLAVTAVSTSKMNTKINLIVEHPFAVVNYIGELNSYVKQMSIRAEQLQKSHSPQDIKATSDALEELYIKARIPLYGIRDLYLGSSKDSELLIETLQKIHSGQDNLLDFALDETNDSEDIIAYEKQLLRPLYEKSDALTATILEFAKTAQHDILLSSTTVTQHIFIWSIIVVLISAAAMILYQFVLEKLNREINFSQKQFDMLSTTIAETFLIFDPAESHCDFVAGNSLRVLGITADTIKSNRKIIYQFMENTTIPIVAEKIRTTTNELPQELAVEYRHPQTRSKRWLLMQFYVTNDQNHASRNVITITDQTNDVVSKMTLQDALVSAQNANNAKRDFLSRMSHEIRTPMNAIIGMTTIAGANIDDKARIEDCLSKISYSSKHLLMLINDILDMSRIENNKMTINNEPFDMYQFINSFISMVYSQVQIKQISFTERLSGFTEDTIYNGDSFRLNQVLLNLMSNAIKFTDTGGKVSLRVECISSSGRKDRIRFCVSDTGIGMTEEAISRIFEPFEQANPSISQKFGGTGLGMPITKNLVSLMGGFIDIKSELGKGTSCTVEIPFEKSDAEIEILPTDMLRALHILVVDDEQDICEHTSLLLSKINIRASWVLSGKEAINQLLRANERDDDYDVCFIDWKMPDMDGVETTRQIRKQIGSTTPIIIISAFDWSEIEQDARAAGANAFVSKPLFLSSVYDVLVNVTNGSLGHIHPHSQNSKSMLQGKRILTVEDNELNLEITAELLKMNGAVVECAVNGQEALELFAKSKAGYFDAILMDIQMPVMNGYEATIAIRKLPNSDAATIPIIATTANAFTEDMAATLAAGMNAHVSKPIDMAQLCKELSKFMNTAASTMAAAANTTAAIGTNDDNLYKEI